MTLRDDYDSPWKDILGEYFEQFMNFFFPDIAKEIDWEKGYVVADKELRQITREAEVGKRLADRMFRVWKKNGDETWIMIHVEIQAQKEKEKVFPRRVYVYNYRIHDLYDRAAVSLAILADDNEDWYESVYFNKTWGCLTLFRFPVAKILDYKNQHDALEVSDNPFAVVVAAHLRTLETKGDTASRRIRKIELTKNLYRRGFKKQDILNLYRFIDWIMVLPEELEESYHQEIAKFEEERKMRYITTAERIGMKKGIEKGVKNTAKNMLKIGLDIGLISRVTGLSEAEIRKLPKERDAEQEHVFAG